jgi:hypothetical protein
MPKMYVAAPIAGIAELILVKSIHSISLILALSPVPFLWYYFARLDLWKDTDRQFLFTSIALIAAICIFIYASARVIAWLLYAVVIPGVVWLFYVAVYGLAWLLRTVIVPGTLWLLGVAVPVLVLLLYAAVCGLARWLWNIGRLLYTEWCKRWNKNPSLKQPDMQVALE